MGRMLEILIQINNSQRNLDGFSFSEVGSVAHRYGEEAAAPGRQRTMFVHRLSPPKAGFRQLARAHAHVDRSLDIWICTGQPLRIGFSVPRCWLASWPPLFGCRSARGFDQGCCRSTSLPLFSAPFLSHVVQESVGGGLAPDRILVNSGASACRAIMGGFALATTRGRGAPGRRPMPRSMARHAPGTLDPSPACRRCGHNRSQAAQRSEEDDPCSIARPLS